MMKISIITPSIRKDFLPIIERCLARQTFPIDEYEWIVISPEDWGYGIWIKDPSKRKGDFYNLNKAWNAGLKEASGELFVSIVDGLWFSPDTLERLWNHYRANPTSCISLAGHHYSEIENGKPEHLVWVDPKLKSNGKLEQIKPVDFELCVASLPIEGVYKVGKFDLEFDKFPAWGEKELACRMEKVGYKFYIDQGTEFRAIHHDKLSKDWDDKFPLSTAYFQKCYQEIQNGKRLCIDNFREKEYKNGKA